MRVVDYFSSAGFEVVVLSQATSPSLGYYPDGTLSDTYVNLDFSLTDECVEILRTCSVDVPVVVSDVDLIVFTGGEDISSYYVSNAVADAAVHRDVDGGSSFHDVFVESTDSHGLFEAGEVFPVASSHHQAVDMFNTYSDSDSDSTPSVSFTAFDRSGDCLNDCLVGCLDGIRIPEVMERIDKPFAVGIQFHPEYFVDHTDEPDYEASVRFLARLKSSLMCDF